jgi:hypothetical protein
MEKYIIHYPKNFESRNYRYYNLIFDKIISTLQEKYDVLVTGYYKYANQKFMPALLLSDTSTYQTPNIQMLECEMIIENANTKEIKALSVSDSLASVILGLPQNTNTTKILVSQYNENEIACHLNNKEKESKCSPWVYFPQNIIDYEKYYNFRQKIKNEGGLKDKFYFRGTSLEYRNIINFFDEKYFIGGVPIGGFDTYARDLLQYKIGYSIAGRGEFCYRDIEYMALGIPFIRFEYTNQMNPRLIPNYHYISVDRPMDLSHDKDATNEHAKLIEQKFIEVKDNIQFLDFIAKNAKQYYEQYISVGGCVKHTLELLKL